MQNLYNFNNFATTTAPKPNSMANFSSFSSGFSTMNPSQSIPNLNSIKLDANLEVAQVIPKPKLKAILNNNERGYYSSLLSQADPINANSVQGKDAVAFFKRSGISVEMLKKIWLLSSSNNTSLEREEFYVALKLIAFAQNNMDISAESLVKNVPTPLPKFAAAIQEKKEEKIEENSQNLTNNTNELPSDNSNLVATNSFSNMNLPPQMQSSTVINGQSFNNPTPLNSFPNQMNANNNMPNNLPQGQNKIVTEADGKISLEKMHKYENYFKSIDPQHTGYIGGAEAKDIFLKSGLPTQQLFQIWRLVDTKKEGNLSKGEFMVALHLIMLARQGFILPEELPKTLLEIIFEYQDPNANKLSNPSNMQHRPSVDLINMPEPKNEDKYSALENTEFIQDSNQNLNMINNEKSNEMPPKNSALLKRSSQQMEYGANDPQTQTQPQQQNFLDHTQNELNNELRKMRNYHSNAIQEKVQDLNNMNAIIENYQKLMKKIQDENQFLIEESKKIEEKKNTALKSIMAYQNNIDILLNKNSEIKQKILLQTTKAIEEINETAKITLDQINKNQATKANDNQNLTLFQRKQLIQEERERDRIKIEENSYKQQQFPKNFDSENFPEVEIKSNEIVPNHVDTNINQPHMQINHINAPFKNEISYSPQMNYPPQTNQANLVENYANSTIVNSEQFNKSNNDSPQRPFDELMKPLSNKITEPIKTFDSDQKDFANFGGFDMNQQDFNNGGNSGWNEFDNNFKGLEEQKTQPENIGFGGFSEFKF